MKFDTCSALTWSNKDAWPSNSIGRCSQYDWVVQPSITGPLAPVEPLKIAPDVFPYPVAPDLVYPWVATITMNNQPVWRVVFSTDHVTGCLDVPGVKADDVAVEINAGVLKAIGKRSDIAFNVLSQTTIGEGYDVSTATAVLELGVLTVTVYKYDKLNKVPTRVPVTAK